MVKRALPILALCLAACGDPLVGPDFAGTPQLSFGGTVIQGSQRIPSTHGDLRLGLFWIGGGDRGDERVEQQARLDSGLAEYELTLFEAPPGRAMGFPELVPDRSLAIGVMVLYADSDQSGGLDLSTDLLLGASAQHVLVYNASTLEVGTPAAELLGPLDPGYHLFRQDQDSTCRFVQASSCPGAGQLQAFADSQAVTLVLWPSPDDVLVPAPALPGAAAASIWAPIP